MNLNNDIEEKVNFSKINQLKSTILDLRENLYVKDLKKNLQEFVREEVNIDFDKSYFVETINEAPTWLQKANFSRTQTDIIAT